MNYSRSASGLYLPASADRAFVKFGAVSFWAENGSVCISAEQPDGSEEFKQVSVDEMRQRRDGLISLAKHKASLEGPSAVRNKIFADFVEGLDRVIKKAEEQGPFEDPSSRRDRVRRRQIQVSFAHNKKSRG
jgi:hypothetical protein